MKIAEKSTEEIKTGILDQAFARFGRYGFGKTTMAEIARDCDMSAGNLYRYFKNKMEIGAECARRCMMEAEELLRDVIRRPGLTASRRLEEFVLAKLRYLHSRFSDQPLLHDLVTFISSERKELVYRHMETHRSLLEQVLAEGNQTGEFKVENIPETARMIQAATTKFNTPHLMGMFPLDELEREAQGVVRLLIRGLANR